MLHNPVNKENKETFILKWHKFMFPVASINLAVRKSKALGAYKHLSDRNPDLLNTMNQVNI